MSEAAPVLDLDLWSVYDAFVRGAMIDELALASGRTVKQLEAEIVSRRKQMHTRYVGITDLEADELRAIYLIVRQARKAIDATTLRIMGELRLRQTDIVTTAAARELARAARTQERYQ